MEWLPSSAAVPSIKDILLAWNGMMLVKTIEAVETGIAYDLGVLEELEGMQMGNAGQRSDMLMSVCVICRTWEDFAIMIGGSNRKYYFQAGLDKIRMSLDEIHLSGNVPQFKEKLQLSMNCFFEHLPLDKPVVQNNYSIQVVKPQKSSAGPMTEATSVRIPDLTMMKDHD
ncbi:hypothetical protein ID866_11800 [Astraeus odoratus]|nr:hypothetical protein ID866_11800 [Astraeus odoratus]